MSNSEKVIIIVMWHISSRYPAQEVKAILSLAWTATSCAFSKHDFTCAAVGRATAASDSGTLWLAAIWVLHYDMTPSIAQFADLFHYGSDVKLLFLQDRYFGSDSLSSHKAHLSPSAPDFTQTSERVMISTYTSESCARSTHNYNINHVAASAPCRREELNASYTMYFADLFRALDSLVLVHRVGSHKKPSRAPQGLTWDLALLLIVSPPSEITS